MVLALSLSTAAGLRAAPQTGSGAAKQPPKAPAQRSDAEIEAAIRAKFAASKINEDKFQVRVQGGVANIEGRTDVIQHKGVATRLAKTGGAKSVNNKIQIGDAARAKAAAQLQKGRVRAQVKRSEPRSQVSTPAPKRN